MPAEEVAKLRNVAVVGQGGAGKTTLADALLFAGGAVSRFGRVDDGTSAFDTEPEEQRRKTTITAALHHLAWRKHEVNLIDAPGYSSFLHDARNCLYAATGAVFVLGPTGGEVKVEAEKLWGWLGELGIPAVAFVTRLDRERADVEHALKYLEGVELSADELGAALRDGARAGKFVPVLCGAAGRAIGLHPLLDAIVDLLPSPADLKPWEGDNPKTGDRVERTADPTAPFSAFVFKTIVDPFAGRLSVLRVVSGRIHADLNCINSARDVRERIGHPLKLEGKKQTQVAAAVAGDIVAVAKLKDVASGDTLSDEKAPIVFAPLPDAPAAISFAVAPKSKAEDGVVGGVIPRNFIPAVEKGIREVLPHGILAGYPIVDLRVKLYDGSYHDVDSSEMSFKIAASMGFKKAFEMCKPVLLEPIMTMNVVVPDECMGDVIGDLNSRRGKVLGVEPKGNGQEVIKAHVPMAEVLRYAPDLRSMTSGRGDFALEFSHYEEVPPHIAEKIIKEAQATRVERHA